MRHGVVKLWPTASTSVKTNGRITSTPRCRWLCDDSAGGGPCVSIPAGDASWQQMVDFLAVIYAKHLGPITNLIHTKPKNRVQEFADAFRLRKDK